jgi:hypothetical protein
MIFFNEFCRKFLSAKSIALLYSFLYDMKITFCKEKPIEVTAWAGLTVTSKYSKFQNLGPF